MFFFKVKIKREGKKKVKLNIIYYRNKGEI
jgi:hypothetical protein